MTQTLVSVTEPQTYLDTSVAATPSTGRTTVVSGTDNLQTILDNALPGDTILLPPGVTYTGNFTIPVISGGVSGGWVTVTTAGSMPAEGTRLASGGSTTYSYPTIRTNNSLPPLATAASATKWRFMGIRIDVDPSVSSCQRVIRLGDGSLAQNSTSLCPSYIYFDRCEISAHATCDCRVGVTFDGIGLAVIESRILEIHSGFDSQCIAATNGPGPFKIVNNFLEAAGENIAWGGATPGIDQLIPSDIEVHHNHLYKHPGWENTWTVKNLYESKNSRRVIVHSNLMENCPVAAQAGFAVVLWSVDQQANASWCGTSHQTFRHNVIKNTHSGFQLTARFTDTVFGQVPGGVDMHHVAIHNNVFLGMNNANTGSGSSRMYQIGDIIENLSIEHNTGFAGDTIFLWGGAAPLDSHVVRNNNCGGAYYQLFTSLGQDAIAWNHVAGTNSVFLGNVVALESNWLNVIPGNFQPQSIADVGLVNTSAAYDVNATIADLGLSPSSAYHLQGTDGTDPGADVATVAAAIALAQDGTGGSGAGTVTPTPSVLTTLVLAPSTLTVVQGAFGAVNATAYDQFGVVMTLPTLTGHTSDGTKATVVVNAGVVTITGVAAGSSTVTVSSGSVTSNGVTVTVSAPPPDPSTPPTIPTPPPTGTPGPVKSHPSHGPKIKPIRNATPRIRGE